MSEKRAGRELAKWVAVTLAVLLGLYVGTYLATVTPRHDFAIHGSLRRPRITNQMVPEYRFAFPDLAFAPIHWLDRRLRPKVWEPDPVFGFDVSR